MAAKRNSSWKRGPYSHLLRAAHWALSVTILVSLYSGVALHCLARPEWSLVGVFPAFVPGGRVLVWHLMSGIVFAPAVIVAAVVFIKHRKDVDLLQARWIANLALIVGGIGCSITMLGLIYSDIPQWLYHICRGTHAMCGMVIIPFALAVHLYLAFTKNLSRIVPIYAPFRNSAPLTLLVAPVAFAISFLVITQVLSRQTSARILVAEKTDVRAAAIEDLKAFPWDSAEALELTLVNGNGFKKGTSRLILKAMHNGEDLFMVAKWQDPGEDRRYWPWLKTEEGWKHLVTEEKDEKIYYEDKFSLVFPVEKDENFVRYGCAIYCHTKGNSYGYKAASRKVDVWHWKSSRTDPMRYTDDKHWFGHDLTLKDVGRIADPKEGGGDAKNNSEDLTTPAFLPPEGYTVVGGVLPKDVAVPYSAEAAAKIPVGAVIPGIIVSQVIGDRGDVQSLSRHDDGWWTLYLKRKLDTGSAHDVKFEVGGAYDFAAAAFDHSAKRHAYNQQVYSLEIK